MQLLQNVYKTVPAVPHQVYMYVPNMDRDTIYSRYTKHWNDFSMIRLHSVPDVENLTLNSIYKSDNERNGFLAWLSIVLR